MATERIKYRYIGLILLIAVAVIFIPILFNFSALHHNTPRLQLSPETPEPPAEPQLQFDVPTNLSPTILQAVDENAQPAVGQNLQQTDLQSKIAAEPGTAQVPSKNLQHSADGVATASDTVTDALAQWAQQDSVVGIQADKKSSQQPSMSALTLPPAWVVQVASFSQAAKAQELLVQLQKQGYDAYSRKSVDGNHHNVIRVFVGPEIHKERAVALQSQLTEQMHLAGIVVQYHV